jgi:hypothetical protein
MPVTRRGFPWLRALSLCAGIPISRSRQSSAKRVVNAASKKRKNFDFCENKTFPPAI